MKLNDDRHQAVGQGRRDTRAVVRDDLCLCPKSGSLITIGAKPGIHAYAVEQGLI